MRFSGIAPKNTNVEYFESLATMHDHRNFEVSAIHIPFYTFAVGMLIAVSIAWAITGESLLPMYLCYIAMVCTFSFFIDGNGFVFFNGIKNASFVAGGCAGLFAVSMVSWIWMKILGKSWLFNFPIFSRVS